MGEKGPSRLRFWLAGVVLAATSTFLALGIVEAVLRLARFEYHLSPTVQVGWPDPETIRAHYAGDADLFWVTQDYRTKCAPRGAATPMWCSWGIRVPNSAPILIERWPFWQPSTAWPSAAFRWVWADGRPNKVLRNSGVTCCRCTHG
jgi:hypothetical protein